MMMNVILLCDATKKYPICERPLLVCQRVQNIQKKYSITVNTGYARKVFRCEKTEKLELKKLRKRNMASVREGDR